MVDTKPADSTGRITRREVLAVLIVFPTLYLVHGFAPHSQRLFVDEDHSAWGAFWATAAILHWTSVAVVVAVLRRRRLSLADIGLDVPACKLATVGGALVALGLAFVFIRSSLGPVDILGGNPVFGIATPWTTSEWIRWIPMAITAGFCEELVYRGFGISAQVAAGATRRRAVTTATVAFVFLHGFSAFFLFPVYIALALAMTAIYRRTNSLLPGMIIHTVIDLSVILASTPT